MLTLILTLIEMYFCWINLNNLLSLIINFNFKSFKTVPHFQTKHGTKQFQNRIGLIRINKKLRFSVLIVNLLETFHIAYRFFYSCGFKGSLPTFLSLHHAALLPHISCHFLIMKRVNTL